MPIDPHFSCRLGDPRAYRPGDLPVVVVAGEIDIDAKDVLSRIRRLLYASTDGLLVACSEVTFIDASGVRLLRDAQREAIARRCTFAIVRPSPAVRRVVAIIGEADLLRCPRSARSIASTAPDRRHG